MYILCNFAILLSYKCIKIHSLYCKCHYNTFIYCIIYRIIFIANLCEKAIVVSLF